jgi:hypothetical protein
VCALQVVVAEMFEKVVIVVLHRDDSSLKRLAHQ